MRTKNRWNCVIQSEDGATVERVVEAYWDPTKENITSDSIAGVAAAEAFVAGGKTRRFVGISAALVTA